MRRNYGYTNRARLFRVELGAAGTSMMGIDVTATVEMPSIFDADAGSWMFIQKVKPGRTWTLAGGQKQKYSFNGRTDLVDTAVPYYIINGVPDFYGRFTTGTTKTATDTPSDGLEGLDALAIDEEFWMYVMFRPEGSTTQWVPLKVVHWTWQANVTRQGNQFTLTSSEGPNPSSPANVTEEPEWANNVIHGETQNIP